MSIPYLHDPGGEIQAGIKNLRVTGVINESPVGRMRCLDAGTHAVYEAMHSILTGEAGITDPVEYSETLNDLADQLRDLHTKTVVAFDRTLNAPRTDWRNENGGTR